MTGAGSAGRHAAASVPGPAAHHAASVPGPVKGVALVAKKGNAAGEAACREAAGLLSEKGVACSVSLHPSARLARSLLPSADLCLVFAGDGTMVSVARQILGRNLPIAGVNFGRVGFLAELGPHDWCASLERALEKGLSIERRMSLFWSLFRSGKGPRRGEVINDVVVTRGKMARLATFNLAVNGLPLAALRSDGLILSTPTGSSGYAGSAGGPLLPPTLEAYVAAAICPYLSSFPPLVLDWQSSLSLTVGEAAPDIYLTLDGQEVHKLAEGDRLEVRGGAGRVPVAGFGLNNYFERLQRAGFVRAKDAS